jgi:peptidoglycan-associated lipoprotein
MKKLIPVFILALMLGACGSQPPAPEQNAAGVESRTPSQVGAESGKVTTSAIDEFSPAQLKNPSSVLSKRSVYFDFDQYVIKDEFKPMIEAHAKFLTKNPSYKMLIQGNADERGSREYNLALGQKRAEAVKKALSLLGAQDNQMEAVSLGKEKPRCTEHTEECWAQNRRADMLYTGEY